jgi:hypothetical protein
MEEIAQGNEETGGKPVPKHGLYRRRRAISELDGRTRQARAFKVFKAGIMDDLGQDLSFGQLCLAEAAFSKLFLCSEAVRILTQKGNLLQLFFNPKLNTAWNATSNSARLDLMALYGPKGVKKAEKRTLDLKTYLLEKAKTSPLEPEEEGAGKAKDGNSVSREGGRG